MHDPAVERSPFGGLGGRVGRGDLAGAARLQLVSGVVQLRPERRCGRPDDRATGLPALPAPHPVASAHRQAVALPQLRGQVPSPSLRRLRSATRAWQPRRARPTNVSDLSTAPACQPRNLHQLRPRPAGWRPHPGRTVLPDPPRVLAHLPRLRHTQPHPRRRQHPLRPLHHPPSPGPTPRRRHRHHPARTTSTTRCARDHQPAFRRRNLAQPQHRPHHPAALTGQPLTHDASTPCHPANPSSTLRSVLAAIGTLPSRDEHLTRLHSWITTTIAARPDPDQQHLLRRYAIWHVLRRLRARLNGADATHHQFVTAKRSIAAAMTLLDRLADDGTPSPPPAKLTSANGWPTTTPPAPPGTSSAGLAATNSPRPSSPPYDGTAPPHRSTRRPAGNTPAACCTRTPSNPRTVSPVRLSCPTPSGPPQSADSPLTTSRSAKTAPACASAASQSFSPNRSPTWPRPRRRPPRTRHHRRSHGFTLAVPQGPTRPAHQRPTTRRTTPEPRPQPRAIPLYRTVPTRYRATHRHPRPHARHPHHRHRRLATRVGRDWAPMRRTSAADEDGQPHHVATAIQQHSDFSRSERVSRGSNQGRRSRD